MADEKETDVADATIVEEIEDAIDRAENPADANVVVIDVDGEIISEDATLPEYEDAIAGAYAVAESLIDKHDLIGIPFVIYAWEFRVGDTAVEMMWQGEGKARKEVPNLEASVDYFIPHDKIDELTGEVIETVTSGPFREFAIVRIVTAPGHLRRPQNEEMSEHLVFTDGGTGIYQRLGELWQKTGGPVRVNCRRGLRVSEYKGPHGGDSETFYLT